MFSRYIPNSQTRRCGGAAGKLAEDFEKTDFTDINATRALLPTADFADPYTIFNIKGNRYRLITIIHYRHQRIYIKKFLTHAEYDKWNKERKSSK